VALNSEILYESDFQSLYAQSGSPQPYFIAPAHLPDGAKVTSIVVFYYDSDATADILIQMLKSNVYTSSPTIMGEWESDGTTGGLGSHKIFPILGGNTINNGGYAYSIIVRFLNHAADDAVRLYNVKINYN
jgi:hypothetical protein